MRSVPPKIWFNNKRVEYYSKDNERLLSFVNDAISNRLPSDRSDCNKGWVEALSRTISRWW